MRRPLTSSSQELLGQSLPNLVFGICRVRRQEILISLTPHKGEEIGAKRVKYIFSLKIFFFTTQSIKKIYSQAMISQTESIALMTMEESSKFCIQ